MKDLETKGFGGFCNVAALRTNSFSSIPSAPGVYAAIREKTKQPVKFLARSPAGWFKGKDPTQRVIDLRNRWIDEAEVIYIGKAGGPATGPDRTLKARIGEFVCFGAGIPCAHWGGRAVWQLVGSDGLVIAWMETAEPRSLEKRLIEEFKEANDGKRPFANMRA